MPTNPNSLDTLPLQRPMRGPGSMRQANEWAVLELLQRGAPLSSTQLAADTGLSRPTVNLAMSRLEAAGLVRQTGLLTGRAGRAARLWEPNVDTGRVVGVDVGAHWIRLALADLGGSVIDRRKEAARTHDATELVQQIAHLVTDLLEGNGVALGEVYSIVIASPGIYDPGSRRLLHSGNIPGWDRPAVVSLLAEELGDRVTFENDIDLAALGEQAAGVGRGVDDFVFLSVGTGIGVGSVLAGRLHRGVRGAAGEVAYLLVGDSTTPADEQRERGMFESAAAADALVAAGRAAGLGDDCTPDRIFRAARDGDAAAEAVVAREVELIARALVPVVALLDPRLVVLGGGALGEHAEHVSERVERRLGELVPLPLPDFAASATGEDATVLGGIAQAVSIAWQRAYAQSQA
ncbi:ROK family transcriptional regulator [Streptomyces fractus]|uniref:ROK family transcriptional regulator n=1 Tax=Streptomyces fractus TaxID=641806 RepID=UPI003CE8FCB0